jgi:hypothetical protein
MKRAGDELSGPGRVWHAPAGQGGADGASDRQPAPGRCHANGCPLAGGLSNGGAQRYCFLHCETGVARAGWITSWLRDHPLAVEALSIPDGITAQGMANFAEQCARADEHELAPRVATITHEGYGKHGVGITVERNEVDYPKLYRQRIRGLVAQRIGG